MHSHETDARSGDAVFGPAPLTDADVALRQNLTLNQCPWFDRLCRLLPVPVLILNGDGVVVMANEALLELAGVVPGTDLAGAATDPDRLLDLGLEAYPLTAAGERYFVHTAAEPGDRQRNLQRTFFHDLLNTAGGVQGLSTVMADAGPEDMPNLTTTVRELADQLVDEITSHRDLASAECGELPVDPRPLDADEVIRLAAARFGNHPAIGDRHVVIAPGRGGGRFVSDPTILGRVLGNTIKNALEATPDGGVVTLDSGRTAGGVWFSVNNPGEIPMHVRGRVFERSYSTKGKGRGLGTFSMRMLTEEFLAGRIGFSTDATRGTTFTVSLPFDGP